MATVAQVSPDHWQVNMDPEAEPEVIVEVHMSRDTANQITKLETERVARLNPGRTDLPRWSLGVAILNVLGLYAANGRVT